MTTKANWIGLIPTRADIEDDMEKIHALHVAHGNTRHCNYCNCGCALCKKEGWKYRPVPYEAEVLPFQPGDVVRVVETFEGSDEGDEMVYMGNRQFHVRSGRNKGAGVSFFANKPCAQLFHLIPTSA